MIYEFSIQKAKAQDYDGILGILQKVSGPNEFIKNHLIEWISDKKYYPLVAIETYTKEYAGFCNTLIYGESLWLEGLRVEEKFRNNHLATHLIQKSYSAHSEEKFSSIGFTTRNDNNPMNTIAKKLSFTDIGQQLVFVKRKNEHKTSKQTSRQDHYIEFKSKNDFYAKLFERYNGQVFTSFFKIPPNELGEKLFSEIPSFETSDYYALYEKNHGENDDHRGIFTFYGKKYMTSKEVFTILSELEESETVNQYPSYSFALSSKDVEITDEMYRLANERHYEVHILNFYEKEL